jgi:uncharacterized protein
MTKDEVISRLKAVEPELRAQGAAALYLFGSHARDEAGASSDVDVFIDRSTDRPFGFVELTNIHSLLENALGTDVDLATRTALHPRLRAEIERTAIRVM